MLAFNADDQFEVVRLAEIPCKVDYAIRFKSFTITPALYLASLVERLSGLGGHLHRLWVPSLDYLTSPQCTALYGSAPAAVVNCTGLGSLTLGGVKDTGLFPTRGQIVRVRAPWIRSGWTRQVGSLDGGEGGSRTYVIPRCNGEVILGGTREEGDWTPYPRADTARDILQRAKDICPELVPEHARFSTCQINRERQRAIFEEGVEPKGPIDDIIIDHLVGFRPSRQGGSRLEREEVPLGGKRIPVVHNYGHGGAGWQSSWGCATDVVSLLEGRPAKL